MGRASPRCVKDLNDARSAAIYTSCSGFHPSATGDEITRAYRNAMKRVHPDAQQPDRRVAAEERAKQLNHAYTTLSRPDRRRQYDTELRASMVQEQIMGRYVGGFGGPNSNAADPFAQRKPRRSEFPHSRAKTRRPVRNHFALLRFWLRRRSF